MTNDFSYDRADMVGRDSIAVLAAELSNDKTGILQSIRIDRIKSGKSIAEELRIMSAPIDLIECVENSMDQKVAMLMAAKDEFQLMGSDGKVPKYLVVYTLSLMPDSTISMVPHLIKNNLI